MPFSAVSIVLLCLFMVSLGFVSALEIAIIDDLNFEFKSRIVVKI